jgi:hypothetical protein
MTFSITVNPDDTLEEHAAEIRKGLQEIRSVLSNALDIALAVGQRLNIAKEQVGNGKWSDWLRDDCELSRSTALLYMRLANHQGDIDAARVLLPDMGLRAARRLLTKSEQPEAKEDAAGEPGEDEPEASAVVMRAKLAELDRDKTPAERLLATWEAASIAERKDFLSSIPLDEMLKVIPNDWRPKLERLVLGNLKSHCTTEKQRDTVRKLEKKRPYLELAATPIT